VYFSPKEIIQLYIDNGGPIDSKGVNGSRPIDSLYTYSEGYNLLIKAGVKP